MPGGTGLKEFGQVFPERMFDVGIAEQHAVTFAAGLAADGYKPFCAIYSTFLQRDENELARMVATAAARDDGPTGFRYARGEATGIGIDPNPQPLEIGKGRVMREGSSVAIFSYGTRLGEAMTAAENLEALGLSTTVADARFAKPLDRDLLCRLADEHEVLITIEEGSTMTLPDIYIDQDSPALMYKQAKLDADSIVEKVFEVIGRDVAEMKGLA